MSPLTDQEQQQANQLLNAAGQILRKIGQDELTIYFDDVHPSGETFPGILLNTLPKSGSMFMTDVFRNALRLKRIRIAGGYFPEDTTMRTWTDRLRRGSAIAQEHLPATYINLVILARRLDRMIVNVRDPRQATLSWTHHIRTLFKEDRQDELAMVYPTVPDDYCDWDLSAQIDWQIQHHLPLVIDWIEGWIRAEADPAFTTRILFTRFEDFKRDKQAFFQRILSHYDIDAKWMDPVNDVLEQLTHLKQRESNFRKGKIDEWRTVFSNAQAERASAMITPTITEQFGYQSDSRDELAA